MHKRKNISLKMHCLQKKSKFAPFHSFETLTHRPSLEIATSRYFSRGLFSAWLAMLKSN